MGARLPLRLLAISTTSGCGGNGGAVLCDLTGLWCGFSSGQDPNLRQLRLAAAIGKGRREKTLPEKEFIRLIDGNRLTVSNWSSHSTLTCAVGQDGAGGVATAGTDHATAGMRSGTA